MDRPDKDEELRLLKEEAREWIEAITCEDFASDDFTESLKDGVLLCKLINEIAPGSVKRINNSKMPFKQMENIANFLKAARAFGVTEFEMFGTPDLYDEKNIPQVVSSLHALGRTVQAKLPGWGRPNLGIKVVEKNVRQFSEEQLRAARNAPSLLNLGSSDLGKKAAMAVLDGTGEMDDGAKTEVMKKQEGYRKEMMETSAHVSGTLKLESSATGTRVDVATPKATAPAAASGPEWLKCETDDGTVYYENTETAETAWELPAGAKLATAGGAGSGSSPAAAGGAGAASSGPEWLKCETDDGTVYYENTETAETAWELPAGAKLAGAGDSGGAAGAPAAEAAEADAGAGAGADAAGAGEWFRCETDDGGVYFEHTVTAETAWELPAGAKLRDAAGGDGDGDAAAGAAAAAGDGAGGNWLKCETDDGTVYYENTETAETAWELPEGGTLVEA